MDLGDGAVAIDTRQKRLGMLNFHDGTTVWLLPDPLTSGIDAAERATLLDLYRGIALAGAPTLGIPIAMHHYKTSQEIG